MSDKPVYYDTERKQLYWVEWLETGNNDIPTRRYLNDVDPTCTFYPKGQCDLPDKEKDACKTHCRMK